jgi:hypothetical protein
VQRQWDVYREFWPANSNRAAFAWSVGSDEPFVALAGRPDLRDAVSAWFGARPAPPAPCRAPARLEAPSGVRVR